MNILQIIIFGQTIAKKNSQRIIKMGRRSAIRPSKAFDMWAKDVVQELRLRPVWQGTYPVDLYMSFYRKTRAKFDFENMVSSIQDVLVKGGVLEDDSMIHVYPVIRGWAVDKYTPRCEVEIRPHVVEGKEF